MSSRNNIIVVETIAGIGCKVKSANVSLNGLNIRQIQIINSNGLDTTAKQIADKRAPIL